VRGIEVVDADGAAGDPGVVDQHVEAVGGGDGVGRRGDAGLVGHVELHEAGAELVGGRSRAARLIASRS
jgi:hypothetical protein